MKIQRYYKIKRMLLKLVWSLVLVMVARADIFYFLLETGWFIKPEMKMEFDALQLLRLFSPSDQPDFATREFSLVYSEFLENKNKETKFWFDFKYRKNKELQLYSTEESIECFNALPSPEISYNGLRLNLSPTFISYCHQKVDKVQTLALSSIHTNEPQAVLLHFVTSTTAGSLKPIFKNSVSGKSVVQFLVKEQLEESEKYADKYFSEGDFGAKHAKNRKILLHKKRFLVAGALGEDEFVVEYDKKIGSKYGPLYFIYVHVDHVATFRKSVERLKENEQKPIDIEIPCEAEKTEFSSHMVEEEKYRHIAITAKVTCKSKNLIV